MKYRLFISAAMLLIFFSACRNEDEKNPEQNDSYQGHKVTVLEVIGGQSYTYLRVAENNMEKWLAISKRAAEVGEVLYYLESLEMNNFESKELGRTFDSIYFVSNISSQPVGMPAQKIPSGTQAPRPAISKLEMSIEPAPDGITIGELFKNRDKYNSKIVILRGKITKLNNQIMGRNWAHVQDGTGTDINYDLTVTTKENLKVGEVVTFKGEISLSKDFGAGYFYDVIMESAEVLK